MTDLQKEYIELRSGITHPTPGAGSYSYLSNDNWSHARLDHIESKFGGNKTYGGYVHNSKFVEQYLGLWYCTRYYKPKNIIVAGTGYGGCVIGIGVAAKENNNGCIINSYDIPDPTHSTIENAWESIDRQGLTDIIDLYPFDVRDAFEQSPMDYDMMYIDIDNSWEKVYDILTSNDHIREQAENGSHIFIEGGGEDQYPKMSKQSLHEFNTRMGREIFTIDHISGWRVSLSKLNIITLQ